MLAYALAFKPCSEATDIGSILSWGSVFWRDLVRIRRIQDFPECQLRVKGMKLAGFSWEYRAMEGFGNSPECQLAVKELVYRFHLFFASPNQKKIVIGSPNSFFYLFLARLNKIIYHFGL